MKDKQSTDVWLKHAKQWQLIGPPLRPCAADHKLMEHALSYWQTRPRPPRALVLGVTPEMAGLAWPEESEVTAVDISQEMIDNIWPGYHGPGHGVICANWLDLPAGRELSFDLVMGDGPFSVLSYPHEYGKLLDALKRVLEPGGLFAFRIMVCPEKIRQPKDIYDAVMDGEFGSFHAFKLCMFMALQAAPGAGIRTADMWTSWMTDGPGTEALASRRNWPLEQIATVASYEGQETVYTFPTLQQIRDVFAVSGFHEVEFLWPTYELGERCPTLIFKRV